MKFKGLALSILFALPAYAQIDWVSWSGKQHLNFKLTNDGVKTIVLSALNTIKDSSGKMSFVIPAQKMTMKDKITNDNFQPVIEIFQEVAELDLTQPFTYTINSTAGTAKSFVDGSKVKLELLSATQDSFIINLSTSLTGIDFLVPKLSICEGKICTKKGLRVDIGGITIKQIANTSLNVSAKIKILVKNGMAQASLYDLVTNLGKKSGPQIDVNFATLKVPPVAVIINGQETSMDTGKIPEIVREYRKDIAHQIILQAANVMKNNVQDIINGFLKGKNFSTKVGGTYNKTYEPINITYIPKPAVADATYVRPHPIYPISKKPELPIPSVQEQIMSELERLISSAEFGLSVSKISANDNKIDIAFNPNLAINGSPMIVPMDIGNGPYYRELGQLMYSTAPQNYNVAVGLSEALVNAIISTPEESLDMVNAILKRMGDFRGIKINYPGIKLHILKGKIFLVVNLHISLDDSPTDGVKDTFYKWLAGISEMFHETHGHLKFPLEIAMSPTIVTVGNKKFLKLVPTSPINGTNLNNTFGYYSNLNKATGALKDEVVNKIKLKIDKSLAEDIKIPLDILNERAELKVDPQAIGVEPSGHLVIYGSILKLDLKKIMEKK